LVPMPTHAQATKKTINPINPPICCVVFSIGRYSPQTWGRSG
jgi:hypothetical protein